MAAISAGKYHPSYADGAPSLVVNGFLGDREPVPQRVRRVGAARRGMEWTSDFDGGKSEHAGHAAVAGRDHHAGEHEHLLSCASAAIGASNAGDYAAFMRYQFRAGLTRSSAQQMLGFRCAV